MPAVLKPAPGTGKIPYGDKSGAVRDALRDHARELSRMTPRELRVESLDRFRQSEK
jgi:hypothetical protein